MKKFFTYSAELIVISIFIVEFVAVFSTGTSDNSELPRDNVVTVEKEGVLEGYTYQDLLDKTPVVIMAHVKSVADPIQIMPVSGTTLSNFTDFTLTVDEVFRGDISVGDEVVVRIEGGQTNGLNVVVEESPELSMNSQMLMFLYQPNMGGAYNTTGDYYYIQGVSQGAFVQAENNENSYVNYAGNITLTLDTLKDDLLMMSRSRTLAATDEDRVYKEFLKNQQINLENGFITQEEYEQLLEEVQNYATTID